MKINLIITLLALIIITGCGSGPEPIRYGQDNCAYCRMLISDPKFGSEFISDKGKIFKFDSIECLAAYAEEGKKEYSSLWVTDYSKPETLLNIETALFIRSKDIKSPMGLYLSAYAKDQNDLINEMNINGDILSWDEVLVYVSDEWL